jgi:hypothetical protein
MYVWKWQYKYAVIETALTFMVWQLKYIAICKQRETKWNSTNVRIMRQINGKNLNNKQEFPRGYKITDIKQEPSVRFEVFTAVTMKNGVFWVVELHGVTTQKTPFFKNHLLQLYSNCQ